MTNEEKELLMKDLCARLPYGVKMQVTLDLSYDTSYNSVEQNCNFVATLYAINIDGDPTDILIHHENDDTANYLNERFTDCPDILEGFIPYLRPMESMTEEERDWYKTLLNGNIGESIIKSIDRVINWLIANHFDFRGLIPMGLALPATEDMYKN